jgi:hypothetical protein
MTWKTSTVNTLVPVVAYILFKVGNTSVYVPLTINIIAVVLVIVIKLSVVHKLIPQFSMICYLKQVVLVILKVIIPASVLPVFIYFLMEVGFSRLILITLASLLSMAVFTYYHALTSQMRGRIADAIINKIKHCIKTNKTKI